MENPGPGTEESQLLTGSCKLYRKINHKINSTRYCCCTDISLNLTNTVFTTTVLHRVSSILSNTAGPIFISYYNFHYRCMLKNILNAPKLNKLLLIKFSFSSYIIVLPSFVIYVNFINTFGFHDGFGPHLPFYPHFH